MLINIHASIEIHKKFKIKDIFAIHWRSFVEEMEEKNKPIRRVIQEEVEKIIRCQDPKRALP